MLYVACYCKLFILNKKNIFHVVERGLDNFLNLKVGAYCKRGLIKKAANNRIYGITLLGDILRAQLSLGEIIYRVKFLSLKQNFSQQCFVR